MFFSLFFIFQLISLSIESVHNFYTGCQIATTKAKYKETIELSPVEDIYVVGFYVVLKNWKGKKINFNIEMSKSDSEKFITYAYFTDILPLSIDDVCIIDAMSSINYKSKKNGKYKYKVSNQKTKYLLVAVQTYSQDGFKDKVSFYLGSKYTALLVVIIVFGVIIGIILLIVGIIYLLRIIERYENKKSAKREREKREIERERAQQEKQRRTQNEQVKDQKQMDNQNQVEQKEDQNKTDNQQQQNNENEVNNPLQGQTEELHLAENIQVNNQIPPTNSL